MKQNVYDASIKEIFLLSKARDGGLTYQDISDLYLEEFGISSELNARKTVIVYYKYASKNKYVNLEKVKTIGSGPYTYQVSITEKGLNHYQDMKNKLTKFIQRNPDKIKAVEKVISLTLSVIGIDRPILYLMDEEFVKNLKNKYPGQWADVLYLTIFRDMDKVKKIKMDHYEGKGTANGKDATLDVEFVGFSEDDLEIFASAWVLLRRNPRKKKNPLPDIEFEEDV